MTNDEQEKGLARPSFLAWELLEISMEQLTQVAGVRKGWAASLLKMRPLLPHP